MLRGYSEICHVGYKETYLVLIHRANVKLIHMWSWGFCRFSE